MSFDPVTLALMKKQLPCYDSRKDLEITWDGVVGDRETFDDGTLVKVSDEILSKEMLEKGTIYIGNGTGAYEISQCSGFVVESEDIPVFSVSPSSADWIVCIYEDFDLAGAHYTKGVYFKTMGEGVAWVEKLLIPNATGELKTIDPKFLPSGGGALLYPTAIVIDTPILTDEMSALSENEGQAIKQTDGQPFFVLFNNTPVGQISGVVSMIRTEGVSIYALTIAADGGFHIVNICEGGGVYYGVYANQGFA